ncbi:MAG: hypothetical protein K0R71_594 [Bacillales bacterium]|jgi:hypothetical protein|nr:hypothetical protein [Bacillales bacterium]
MKISLCIELESFVNSPDHLKFESRVEEIDNLIEYIRNIGDTVHKSENIYYFENADGKNLIELLYEVNPKQEHVLILLKNLEMATSITELEYEEFKDNSYNTNHPEAKALIPIYKNSAIQNPWLVTCENDLSEVHIFYLKFAQNIEEFLYNIESSFRNLKFSDDISSRMKTLSHPFRDYIEEVISHLIALNNNFLKVFIDKKDFGYQEICNVFQATVGITTSPEKTRDILNDRKFRFTMDNKTIEVVCELHTKFDSLSINNDRLYFKEWIDGDNKLVLVGHIGRHL